MNERLGAVQIIISPELMDTVLKYFAMITHHMGLLSKSSVAHLTHEWLLASVDFKMLLEIKSLRVNQQPTDGAALIVGPRKI